MTFILLKVISLFLFPFHYQYKSLIKWFEKQLNPVIKKFTAIQFGRIQIFDLYQRMT